MALGYFHSCSPRTPPTAQRAMFIVCQPAAAADETFALHKLRWLSSLTSPQRVPLGSTVTGTAVGGLAIAAPLTCAHGLWRQPNRNGATSPSLNFGSSIFLLKRLLKRKESWYGESNFNRVCDPASIGVTACQMLGEDPFH